MMQKSEVRSQKSEKAARTTKNLIFLFSVFCFLFSLIGCEAFVRKFTRKSKKDEAPQEQMVLAPIEYPPPQMTSEEKYRQYFLYWRASQDELIDSLARSANHKKQISTVCDTIRYLEEIKNMLKQDKQQKMISYLGQFNDLKASIEDDTYSFNIAFYRSRAERLRRDILRDLSYNKIKKDLYISGQKTMPFAGADE